MQHRLIAIWGLAGALFALSLGAVHAGNLKIAAAANLQKIMTEALIPAFQKKTGQIVTPTFGSTKLLARQIAQGAPVDLFIAADTATVSQLAHDKLVMAGSVRVYAVGKLVMWTRKDSKRHPKRVQDLANPAYAKVAIANPQVAPYGLAAEQALARAHVEEAVKGRIVRAENIAQSLAYARSGNADVALTALSLVIEDKSDPYVIVSDHLHDPITQAAGIVANAAHPATARQFLDYLTSADASPIWKRYGYGLPRK